MKKLLTMLLMTITLSVATHGQNLVSVTAIKKNGAVMDTTVIKLNPKYINYVKRGTTDNYIGYQNFFYANKVDEYTVTDKFDSIYNRANRYFSNLVKLNNVTLNYAPRRDTIIQWAYPVASIFEVKPGSFTLYPQASSTVQIQYANFSKMLYIGENPSAIASRIDSIQNISRNLLLSDYRKVDTLFIRNDSLYQKIQGNQTFLKKF